uniref:Uncharacterized protein n=1 Tax=Euplotes harpa TaxID=151035 RepID=A0A7S3N3X2_9SPIT
MGPRHCEVEQCRCDTKQVRMQSREPWCHAHGKGSQGQRSEQPKRSILGLQLKRMVWLMVVCLLVRTSHQQLLMVYQVGRHGLRSSKTTFEGIVKDKDQDFKIHHDSLTKLGLRQTFQRGEDVMNMDIPNLTSIDNAKFRSTNTSRSILSAYAHVLGMFGSPDCK